MSLKPLYHGWEVAMSAAIAAVVAGAFSAFIAYDASGRRVNGEVRLEQRAVALGVGTYRLKRDDWGDVVPTFELIMPKLENPCQP